MGRPRNINPTVRLRQNERGGWECYWSAGGKVVRRGCDGANNREHAESAAARKFGEWQNPPPPSTYTLGDLIDAYVKARKSDPEQMPSASFDYTMKPVRAWFGHYRPKDLGDEIYKRYRRERTAQTVANAGAKIAAKNGKAPKKVKDSTAIKELDGLRGAIGWGKRNPGWRDQLTDVRVHIANRPDDVRPEFLEREEYERLIQALNDTPHLKLFVMLSVATGARMSAVLEMTWDKIIFPESDTPGDPGDAVPLIANEVMKIGREEYPKITLSDAIRIDMGRGRGNKRRGSGYVGRNNVRLYFALSNAHLEANNKFEKDYSESGELYYVQKPPCPYVISYQGRGIKSVDLSDAFERAGIPVEKRRQHVLTHTTCSWLVIAGVSYQRIGKLVGKSADIVERVYGWLRPKDLVETADQLRV